MINGDSSQDYSGQAVSGVGDVNGDGLNDLIVGAYNDNGTIGASFVVFGKTNTAAVELSDIKTGVGGFVISGINSGDNNGVSVNNAGDVNGDGLDDLIVGNQFDNPNNVGTGTGSSFVVFGKANTTAVNLSAIEAGSGGGFSINVIDANDRAGISVSSAGDINGDGLDDLIVGADYSDPNGNHSGASYVVYGKTSVTAIELSDIALGQGGFVINGAGANDQSGLLVNDAGDINGDGFDDLIVGAYHDDPNSDNSGATFVIFGGLSLANSVMVGTTSNETLTGTNNADQIFGGQGNDILIGAGGADVLRGGAGNDIIGISDTTFAMIDGGHGNDTLRFDGPINLDLSALADNKISQIETIDMTNDGGNSTLTLNLTDVLQITETDAFNTLAILGDAGDIVNLLNNSNGQSGNWVSIASAASIETYGFTDTNANLIATIDVDAGILLNII